MKSIKSMIIALLLLCASCASARELIIVPAEYDYSLDNPAVAHEIVRMIYGCMPLEPDPETVTIHGPYLFWQMDEAAGQIVQEHEYLRSIYYHINYRGEVYPVSLHRRADGSLDNDAYMAPISQIAPEYAHLHGKAHCLVGSFDDEIFVITADAGSGPMLPDSVDADALLTASPQAQSYTLAQLQNIAN